MSRSLRVAAPGIAERWKPQFYIFRRGTSCMLIVAGLLGTANAQVTQPAKDDIWTRATLTGDWDGLRSRLERNGVGFNLNYITEIFANVHGGIRRGSTGNGLFQPQMDVDLEKLTGWPGGRFRAAGIVTHGPAFTPAYVGSISPVSSIEAGPIARAYELWYEHNFDARLSVRAGLITLDGEFTDSQVASTFIGNTFGWNVMLSTALPAGGPAYPISAPGSRVRIKAADDWYFQAAIFSGDPSGGNGSNALLELPKGTVFSTSGGVFIITEVGHTPNQDKNSKGLPGAYKIGGWYHTSSRFGDQRIDNSGRSLADPLSSGIALDHSGNWGIYGVVEQMLYRVPGSEIESLSGFVRVFAGSPADRNLINFYADAGLVYTGLIPGRPEDKIGIAAAFAKISDRARARDRDTAFLRTPPFQSEAQKPMLN